MDARQDERARIILLLSPLLTLAIGVTDYFTGPFLSFSPIYLIPIILAAWFGSLSSGLILCIFSVIVLFICDFFTFPVKGVAMVFIWNSLVRLVLFSGIVYLLEQRKKSEHSLRDHESRIRKLFDALPVGVFVLDKLGKVSIINRMASEILGKDNSPENPADMPEFYQAYVAGKDQLYAHEDLPVVRALKGERIAVQDIEIRRNDRNIPLSVTAAPIRDDNGDLMYAVAAFSDITEQKLAEQQIIEANQKLHSGIVALEERNREITLLSHVQEALHSSLTTSEALESVSESLPRLIPGSSGALYISNDSENIFESRKQWSGNLSSVASFGPSECQSIRRGRIYSWAKNRAETPCSHMAESASASICAPMISQADIVGLLHLFTGPEDCKAYSESDTALIAAVAEALSVTLSNLKLRDKLHSLAVRDPLTNLFNRRYMAETLIRELSRAKRNDKNAAVIMIDIDHFKKYNDTHGHPAGDRLLKEFGQRLQSTARKEDIACRLGGEEFMLLLLDVSPEDVFAKAEKIRLEIERMHNGRPGIFPSTASFGISFFPTHGTDSEEIMRAADAALYEAKGAGRNCIRMAL